MNMKIGEIIRKLRRERDITQEKLADYLGISYQAVSKWENGTALPDITLVVPLANFFGVSTDELFSRNEQVTNEKVREYEEKSRKFFNLGDMQACIDLMREALAEYPQNYKFMLTLARAIQWNHLSPTAIDNNVKDNKKANEEIIQLCERILEDCTDNNTRHETMQILCTAYKNAGQTEKAIKIAEEMPSFSASSDWLLSGLYEGEKQVNKRQGNILFCIWFAAIELTGLADNFSRDEKIMHLEAVLKLYDTIFYDGNALYYHTWIQEVCFNLACCYMQKGDTDKAMHYLLQTEKHAAANDDITEEPAYYTSLFVNTVSHSTTNTFKSYTETSCEVFLDRLNDKHFENMSANHEFTALKERLANK